jgi:hypothetical protein
MALFPMMSGLAWPNVVNPPHFGGGGIRRRGPWDVTTPEIPAVGANGLLGQFDPNAQYPAVEPEEYLDPRYSIQPGTDQGFGSYQASAADFGEKQPQQARMGGLFGGGPQNINLALLQAGLGTMAAGGWQKMPVTLGQAIGQGSYPSVQTQISQNKWDEQRGMREEELNIRRMTGEAYRDQLQAQKQAASDQQKLYGALQERLAAGDMEGAKKIAQQMAFRQNAASAYKEIFGEGEDNPAPTKEIDGRIKQWNPKTKTYDIDIGKATERGPLVSVGVNAYDKKEGSNLADQMDTIQKAGFAATGDIQRYDRLGALLGQVSTGKFKGTTLELKAAAKGLGFDLSSFGIADDVAPAQAARALSRALALELRNPAGGAGMPGALSDSDRQFLESMVPGVESDPGAWPQMIEAYKQLKRREMQVAKLAREYAKRNKGNLDYGFLDELQTFSEQNPLFQNTQQQRQSVRDKYRLE